MALDKLIKPIIKQKPSKIISIGLLGLVLTLLQACGSPGATKIDDDSYYQLEQRVMQVFNSEVANAAPMEMQFIKEKLQLAKEAKAKRKKKDEMMYTEQINADIKIAQLRAELNALNNELLDKRDAVSASQMYLLELQERLQ